MADTIASLEIALGLVGLSAVTGGLREVSGALGLAAEGASTLNRAQMAGGLLASGAALTGLAAGIGKVAEAGISFQDMLITTQNNTTMTTADVAALSAGVLQLARDAGVGTDVLANGFMRAMNISGDTAASMAILRVATESAVSTGGNAAATTNVLANAMHEYGLDIVRAKDGTLDLAAVQENAARTMGIMHLASAEGNMTLEQFSEYSGRAIGIAANLGISLSDVSAAFTSLTKHGYDAAGAQTQVVALMTHLINPTKAAHDELVRLTNATGIDLLHDFSAEGLRTKGLVGVIDDVRAAFRAMGYDEAQATGEAMKLVAAQRGGLGLASLIGTGAGDYASILADLNDKTKTTNITDEAFARTQETVANQLARLRQELQTTADVVGTAMLPQLGRLLGFVTPLVDGIAGWVRAHADAIGPILATVGGVTALVGVGLTLAGTLGFLSIGLTALGPAVIALAGGLGFIAVEGATVGGALAALMGPVGLVIAGVTGLGVAWRTNFAGIRDTVVAVAGLVVPALRAVFTAFQTGDFNAAFGTIITRIDGVFGADVAGNLTLGISNALNVAQVFRDVFITVGQALQGNWFGGQTDSINVWVRTIGRGVQLARDAVLTFRDALSGNWFGGDTSSIDIWIRTIGQVGVYVRALALGLRPAFGLIGDAFALLTGGAVAGGMDGFRGRVSGFTDNVLRQVEGLAGLLVSSWLRVGAAFWTWLTPVLPRLLEGVGTLFVNLVNLITGTGGALVEGAISSTMPNAFMQWVGPAIQPFLTAVGRFWDALGTWMHDTALPAITRQLGLWGGAFASWAGELWSGHIWPGLVGLWVSFNGWFLANGPAINRQLAAWGGAFGAWAGALWNEQIEPGLGRLWTQFSAWIGTTAPVIAERAKVWGAALWQGLVGGAPKMSALGQGVLGDMNGAIGGASASTGNGIADFLNGLNANITTWGATTGRKAMQDALRAALTAGPSVADVGDGVIDGTKKALDPQGGPAADWLNTTAPKIDAWLNSAGTGPAVQQWWATTGKQAVLDGLTAGLTAGPSVAQVGQTVLDWLNALADWVGPKLVASSHWINMGDLIGKAIFSGLPQWAQNGLNAIGGGGTPPVPADGGPPPAPGGGGGGGGGGARLLGMPLGSGGGGGVRDIIINLTGPTTEELARSLAGQLYDALAPLLGESGGNGGGLTTGGESY